ncbi:ureidoglycolate dehydrogenase [Sporolactobacillus sp. THM7-4]|nr:ureidoglycolate dehydrogenase [Sporolactobacillus sp. THM7-4]
MAFLTISYNNLKKLVVNKLKSVGIEKENAETVAEILVHADLRGVSSHGVLRTEHYVTRILKGGLNPHPDIKFKETGPSTGILDGDNGLGHINAKKAMEHAIEMSKKHGIGFVGVINSSHCGALSYYVNLAAKQNLVGLAMTHTDKSVVPYGGTQPFFGTNPIAFGFPAKRHKPIILDMATSGVAFGKILQARETGNKIPSNWGVDEHGEPVTDPFKVKFLLPAGGAKGYGLALAVDVLSGILMGLPFGPHIVPMYGEYDKVRRLGHFLGAINPNFFGNTDTFLNTMDQMIDEIHEAPPAKGYTRVMVPGEPEQVKEDKYLTEGIPVTESVYNYLIK